MDLGNLNLECDESPSPKGAQDADTPPNTPGEGQQGYPL